MSTSRVRSAISTKTPLCSSACMAANPVMLRADTSTTRRVGSQATAPRSGAGAAESPAIAPISRRSASHRRMCARQSSRAAMNTDQSIDAISR